MKKVEKFLKDNSVEFRVLGKSRAVMPYDESKTERDVFNVRLTRKRKSWTFDVGASDGVYDGEPAVWDVLETVNKNEVKTFDEFCEATGFDRKNKDVRRIWGVVAKEYENLSRIFGELIGELRDMYADGSWDEEVEP